MMRRYDKTKAGETLISANQSMLPELLSEEEPELSISFRFLNYISKIQAGTLLKEIYEKGNYTFIINQCHVDADINVDEIISFTSDTFEDGK
jgi:hypothetical protein